jgi:hypothetical protein
VLPDGMFSNQILPIWANVGKSSNGRCWYFYDHFVFLESNGIFYGRLVHFVVIWYIFSRFGMLHRAKSGNPGFIEILKMRTMEIKSLLIYPQHELIRLIDTN